MTEVHSPYLQEGEVGGLAIEEARETPKSGNGSIPQPSLHAKEGR